MGRVDPIKGIEDFIKAAAIIRLSESKVKFLVVGSGPDEYIASLIGMTKDAGVNGSLQFLGFRDDVPQILRQMDILVLATYDRDGCREEACPNIVLEAMASKKISTILKIVETIVMRSLGTKTST